MREVILHILGAGSPIASASRFGTSQVLQLDDAYLMFDCGPKTTFQLARAGIPVTAIHRLFFTHHHFDHDADYALFALCRWDQGLGKIPDLEVAGPRHTALITERLLGEEGAFAFDWKARVEHPLSQKHYVARGGTMPRTPPRVNARDVSPGRVASGMGWEVSCALADHVQPYLESLAYRIDTEEVSLVITGDTAPCATVEALSKGADVMVAMCGGSQANQHRDGTDFGQMGTTWAGELAERAGVKTLILTHMGPGFVAGGYMEQGIAEVARAFGGEIVFPHELMAIPLTGRTSVERPGA